MELNEKMIIWKHWIDSQSIDIDRFDENFSKYSDSGYFKSIPEPTMIVAKIDQINYTLGNKKFYHKFDEPTPILSRNKSNHLEIPAMISPTGIIDLDLTNSNHIKALQHYEGFIADPVDTNPNRSMHSDPNDTGKTVEEKETETEIAWITPDLETIENNPQFKTNSFAESNLHLAKWLNDLSAEPVGYTEKSEPIFKIKSELYKIIPWISKQGKRFAFDLKKTTIKETIFNHEQN